MNGADECAADTPAKSAEESITLNKFIPYHTFHIVFLLVIL